MRNYAKAVLVFGILMLTGIILFVNVSGDISESIAVDNEKLLILNDIVKDAEEKMDSPDSLEEKDYGVDFVVLDSVGNEVYKTPGAEKRINEITDNKGRLTVEAASKKRLIYRYVIKDERIVGSVVLLDTPEEGYARIKSSSYGGAGVMYYRWKRA